MKGRIAAVMLFGLCACGSGGEPIEGGAGRAEPPPVTATTEDSTADQARTTATVSRQVCAFLAQEVPRLEDRDSTVAAVARFAVDYSGWVGKDLDRVLAAVGELDAITTSSCPKVRKRVLAVLDHDSFADVLGR